MCLLSTAFPVCIWSLGWHCGYVFFSAHGCLHMIKHSYCDPVFLFLFVFYQLGLLRKCLKDACFCPVDRAGPAIGTAGQRRAGVVEGVSDACRSAWGRARGRNLQVHIRECTCWQKTFLISLLLSKIIDYLLNT